MVEHERNGLVHRERVVQAVPVERRSSDPLDERSDDVDESLELARFGRRLPIEQEPLDAGPTVLGRPRGNSRRHALA